jgi:hypothetical protein
MLGALRRYPNPLSTGETEWYLAVLDVECKGIVGVSGKNCHSHAGADSELVKMLQ